MARNGGIIRPEQAAVVELGQAGVEAAARHEKLQQRGAVRRGREQRGEGTALAVLTHPLERFIRHHPIGVDGRLKRSQP